MDITAPQFGFGLLRQVDTSSREPHVIISVDISVGIFEVDQIDRQKNKS